MKFFYSRKPRHENSADKSSYSCYYHYQHCNMQKNKKKGKKERKKKKNIISQKVIFLSV